LLGTGGGLVAVIVLVLINAIFVAAEYSLVTIRRSRVEQMLAEGKPGARGVDDAVRNLDSYLATVQIGITMGALALGWIGEPALAHLFEPLTGRIGGHALSVVIVFAVMTSLSVIAGELAPRGIALQYPERVALILATPLRLLRVALRPVTWALTEGGWALLRLVGVRRDVGAQSHIAAEELRLIVQASARAGAIETSEQFLLERVLRFGDLTVANVMIPRTELVGLPVEMSTAEAIDAAREHRFSRYPVYRGDIDDIIGVLHVRDLLVAEPSETLLPVLREPLVVPSHISVERLLTEMRVKRGHFAIAVDEFGGTDGIVTLENVLEAIVGELQDEFEEADEEGPQRGPGGRIRIDGMENVDVLGELLGAPVEDGPYNTVAGFVLDRIGRIPEVGESVEVGAYALTVAEMDDLRIATVEARPLPARTDGGETATGTAQER
jgi:CBS domain containing-hemolysin-like protein